MTAAIVDDTASKGEYWTPVFRWGTDDMITKAITAITRAAPAVVTATGHGLPNGWPCVVVSAGGMTQINAPNYPPRGSDWTPGTATDANTVTLNKVNSADFSAYTSGGFLVYPTPVDLAAVTACELTIYDNPDHTGTPLVTLAIGTGITLDNTAKTISAQLATAALTWDVGYYELMVTTVGIPKQLISGTLSLLP